MKIGVNGYGVIGRRVADAVAAQPDMQLAGVVKVKPDYKARIALDKGYSLYAADEKALEGFRKSGVDTSGVVDDLLREVDIVVDASPGDVGAQNKAAYEKYGRKAIFQGGEEHEVAGFSFVAQCDFDAAVGRRYVRVVSCNTTALCRVLHALDKAFGIEKARVVIARRAADPEETGRGPIDAVALDPVRIPSHHGPDVTTVLPHIKIVSLAFKIPTTHMHLHSLIVSCRDGGVSKEDVARVLDDTTRVILVEGGKGFKSTASVMDYARELHRGRSDLFEAAVWRDSIEVQDGEVYMYLGVHQESIVVPENIDAIRALKGGVTAGESISLTNRTLGILK